jgi:endo-1,4-beta-xylanase
MISLRRSFFFPAFLLLLLFSFFTGAAAQGPDRDSMHHGNEWIETDHSEPAGTHYELFATPSRGVGTQASCLLYLPPDYEKKPAQRFPVLYWLHGGAGSQREGVWMVQRIDAEIRSGSLPPFIIVLVQGLPDVRYINSKDGTRPVENVIINDLIPHIDSTYRTIARRQERAIEGMSMGGFGALRLGFKYPQLFGTVSALAPSIKPMAEEPEVVREPFGDDQAYWDEAGPWNIVEQNAGKIRGRTRVRLLVGDQDPLLGPVTDYHTLLTSLGIEHQFAVVAGAHHRYDQIISGLPGDALQFWKTAFTP